MIEIQFSCWAGVKSIDGSVKFFKGATKDKQVKDELLLDFNC
mgnify:CR=1 FL=1